MQRYDYLERIIHALAAALARIAGRQADGDHAGGLEEVRNALDEMGLNPYLVRSLDAGSLGRILGDPEKRRAVARLFVAEAELLAALGRDREAAAQRWRALALYRASGDLPAGSEHAAIMAELEAQR